VAMCLCWPWNEEKLAEIEAGGEQVQDWERVVRIATRHRVMGLVYRGCQRAGVPVPADVLREQAEATAAQTRQTMAFALESVRLQRLFREAGVDVLFLKGVALTMLAYGDFSLRHAKDIDLLISLENNEPASELLRQAGYLPRFSKEKMSPEQYSLWLKHSKGMEWFHPGKGIELEMHWRLTDMPTLVRDLLRSDRRQEVSVGSGAALTTLDTEHLFAFLCVHGAAHGWSRLKWLADVHALLPQGRPVEIERLYRRSAELGARRAAGQALLLCQELLGLELGDRLRRELEDDWVVCLLKWTALVTILRSGSEREIYDMEFGTTFVYLSRFLLANGWQFLVSEGMQRAYPPDRVASTRMNRRLIFLFPVLRLMDWVSDHLLHLNRPPASPR
jgi:hypothetical protein